jgi:hypothetical protein
MSTLYFAAAVRDNGGGTVIGSEIVPAKVDAVAVISPLDSGTIWYQNVVPHGTQRGADDREVAYAG